VLTLVSAGLLWGSSVAAGISAPTLIPSIHSGWEVNRTTRENVCLTASGDRCEAGRQSDLAGGFKYLSSVAVDPISGDVYVADTANNRIQKLTATGEFLLSFGWDVNRTKERRAGASQAEKNVCTASSGDVCKAGVPGTATEQLDSPGGVAVAPVAGDVYVLSISPGDFRVDKYTPSGQFIWRIGKDVDGATRGNLCVASASGVSSKCRAGSENSDDSLEPFSFKMASTYGDLIAVGGNEELLYVGDEHRVQEFTPSGRWRRQIALVSLSAGLYSDVAALAPDEKGNLYLVYRGMSLPGMTDGLSSIVYKFNREGELVGEIHVAPRRANAMLVINGLAYDGHGSLAVIGNEIGVNSVARFAALYGAGDGARLGSFTGPSDNDGIAFNDHGDLYVAATDDQEVVTYIPGPFSALVTNPIVCEADAEGHARMASDCAWESWG